MAIPDVSQANVVSSCINSHNVNVLWYNLHFPVQNTTAMHTTRAALC